MPHPSVLLALVVVVVAAAATPAHAAAASGRPHLLLVAIDDLGFTDLGFQGAEYSTPTIDALAAEGVKLSNYYVEPTCTPSRTAFMTGRYPFRSGMQSLQTILPGASIHIPLDTPTVAELVKAQGFETFMVGKWHLGYSSVAYTPTRRGFDHFVGFYQGAQYYYAHTVPGGDLDHPEVGLDFWRGEQPWNATGVYNLDIFRNETLSMLAHRNQSKPAFMYLSFETVHAPLEAPPDNAHDNAACADLEGMGNRWVYCLKMQALDRALADILKALKDNNMWEDTFAIFTTDNGGMVDVPLPGFTNAFTRSEASNFPLRGGKATCFEGGVKGVGFLFGGAIGRVPALRGTTHAGLFHAVDVPATLMAAAGVDLPANFDGLDMVGVAQGSQDPRTLLPLHIEELGHNHTAIREGDWKLIVGRPLYDGYFRPGHNTTYPKENCTLHCLFNVTADPTESTNLAHSHTDVVLRLRLKIDSFLLSGDYKPVQNGTSDPHGWPSNNGGVWAPWQDGRLVAVGGEEEGQE